MGRTALADIDCNCAENLCRYIGQTITIFTASGGLSGSGFTGVLISADCECIRLLTAFGLPPACPIGSACTGSFGGENFNGRNFDMCNPGCGCDNGFMGNPFGSMCVIPTSQVVSFALPVF